MDNGVALVTGGGRGIGAATCVKLAGDGFRIAVADIDLEGAQTVARRLTGAGHRAFPVDVTDEESVAALFAAVDAGLGPVTAIVCAAGGPLVTNGEKPSIVTTSVDTWVRTDALNARATFLCIRAFLRQRAAAPVPHGRIVTLSSNAAVNAEPQVGAPYSASKAAIIALTRLAAVEGAPLGVTANAVAPGLTDTPAIRRDLTEEQIAAISRHIPVGSICQPEDIAAMIAFLVAPASDHVTGGLFEVNGGQHMA